jgi:hypothetical protein
MQSIFKYLILVFLFVACKQKPDQTTSNTIAPKVFEANGYIIPKDSISDPKVILVD